MSNMLNLSSSDAFKSAISAIVAAIVVSLYGVVTQAGFDLFSADWGSILKMGLNAAFIAFIGNAGRNFITDSDGKVLGSIQLK